MWKVTVLPAITVISSEKEKITPSSRHRNDCGLVVLNSKKQEGKNTILPIVEDTRLLLYVHLHRGTSGYDLITLGVT